MDVNKVPVSGTVESGTLDVPVLDASWVMRLEKRLASIEERLEKVDEDGDCKDFKNREQDESPNAVGGNISYKYREPPASESTGGTTQPTIQFCGTCGTALGVDEEAQPTEGTLEAGPMHPRIPPIKTGNDYLMSFDDGYEYEVYRITKLSGDAENCEIRFRRMGDGSCSDT